MTDEPQMVEIPPSSMSYAATFSPTFCAIAAALAKAQGEFVNPAKNRTVTVRPRDPTKQPFTFKYATLDAIMDAGRKPLADNELAIVQIPTTMRDGTMILITRLLHSSGEWIESRIDIQLEGQGIQALGSAITYLKRYALSSLLCIAGDEDDDGNASEGSAVVKSEDKAPVVTNAAAGKEAKAEKPAPAKTGAKPTPAVEPAAAPPPTALPATGGPVDPGVAWFNKRLDEMGTIQTPEDLAAWDKHVLDDFPAASNIEAFKVRYPNLHADLMTQRADVRKRIGDA